MANPISTVLIELKADLLGNESLGLTDDKSRLQKAEDTACRILCGADQE